MNVVEELKRLIEICEEDFLDGYEDTRMVKQIAQSALELIESQEKQGV